MIWLIGSNPFSHNGRWDQLVPDWELNYAKGPWLWDQRISDSKDQQVSDLGTNWSMTLGPTSPWLEEQLVPPDSGTTGSLNRGPTGSWLECQLVPDSGSNWSLIGLTGPRLWNQLIPDSGTNWFLIPDPFSHNGFIIPTLLMRFTTKKYTYRHLCVINQIPLQIRLDEIIKSNKRFRSSNSSDYQVLGLQKFCKKWFNSLASNFYFEFWLGAVLMN